jgi:hypothetical protein
MMQTPEIDEEDIMECKCYMLFNVSNNGGIYPDRVYRTKALAEKRKAYLDKLSGGRGIWHIALSELGK